MQAWLTQFFINSSFVLPWGAALVASPIIIHLINRLRYRRVRFAAMEFLLQSEKRNRRRLLIEQLLLLLLRILIVLALLALIARLILDPSQMSLFRGQKVHHFVVLDDSGSMRAVSSGQSAFQDAKDVLQTFVREGVNLAVNQQLTLVLLSDPDQPLYAQRDMDDKLLREIEQKLDNLEASYVAGDFAAAIQSAKKSLLSEKDSRKQLHLISDFRSADWNDQPAVGQAIQEANDDEIAVNLVRVVDEPQGNLAITNLTGDFHLAVVKIPTQMSVSVKNYSNKVINDVRVSIEQDGVKLPLNIVIDKIEADQEVTQDFSVIINEPGKHQLRLSIPADTLVSDNERFVALDVADDNKVLLVNGQPGHPQADYLHDAISADPTLTGINTVIDTVDYLRRKPLDEFGCIFMLNVSEIPSDAIVPLEAYVENGGGLAWYVGDAVYTDFYNEKLYQDGSGLFPVPLGETWSELNRNDLTADAPDLSFVNHPVFRIFAGQDNPFVDGVTINKYFPVADDWERDDNKRNNGVTTIATLRNSQPFMFEHRYGKGRVITCLTTAGPDWNDWANGQYSAPSYVVMNIELQRYLSDRKRSLPSRIVGKNLTGQLDPREYLETVEITVPGENGPRVIPIKASAQASDQPDADQTATDAATESAETADTAESVPLWTYEYNQTDYPGVYQVKQTDQNQQPIVNWFAYNVPGQESDLAIATNEEIADRAGNPSALTIQNKGQLKWIEGKDAGQEARTVLLILLVVFFLCEQLLAFRLSFHPTQKAGAIA